ncbi:MAG: riboflavin synthase [Cyanobacteria bacterium]|nr:riboflavin synthase [Cyanobacteriota bacterium]
MFTGLIEEVGTVRVVEHSQNGSLLTITASKVLEDASLGASISIDGVCTTVITFERALDDQNPGFFQIEASPETLRKTTFSQLQSGAKVNLERPLLPTSRLGGHFVSGHIDCTARLRSVTPEGNSWILWFELDQPGLSGLFIEKGSVAVSGISLTVNLVKDAQFSVAIIPHTYEHTSISSLNVGDSVNIEADILGKYVQRLLSSTPNTAETALNFVATAGPTR